MDWYPFYFTLYEQDTMHLNPYQDGCYRRLIDHYMKTRSPLPDNDAALARIVGDSYENWINLASTVIRAFFKQRDGMLYHKRCNDILDEQDNRSKKRTKSAVHAAKKRWEKNNINQTDNANGMRNACETHAEAMRNDATRQDKTRQDNSIILKDNSGIPSKDDLKIAIDLFNSMAGRNGISQIQKLTDTRKKQLQARLKDCGGIDGWTACLEKVEKSSFLKGANDRGWIAGIDFIIKESNFTKIMEGVYDPKNKLVNNARNNEHEDLLKNGW